VLRLIARALRSWRARDVELDAQAGAREEAQQRLE
jgi:hypothetical protein